MRKFNTKLILFAWCAFSSAQLFAQGDKVFGLQDCIEFAIKNQPRMKTALMDEELQREKNNEVAAITKPQVSANGQFQYLFIIPKQRAAADAFDFSSSLSFFKIDTPAFVAFQQQPKQKYSELQFGLPLNLSAGVQATQILFDAGVFVALKARKGLEELSTLNTKRTEEDIRLSVSKAYYNCVIAGKRMKLLEENITMLSAIEVQTSKLFDEGFVERIDVDRLTVQLNNLNIEKQKIKNLIELSYALLKFQMGMDLNKNIGLDENLTMVQVKEGLDLDKVVDYTRRIEMDILKKAKSLNQLDYERYQKSYLPTLTAAISTSLATQTQSFGDLFKYSYFPTGAFVLNASMPIYGGGARRAKMNQVKLNLLKNDNDMEAFKQAVNFESHNARTQLKNSIISLENQEANIKLAEKVFDIAQKKFKEGVGTNIEIIQAETALKEAQTNYYNSLYEAVVAKIDFQKSLGLLK
jgi:outer membrane protein